MTKPTTEELKDLLAKVTQGEWVTESGYGWTAIRVADEVISNIRYIGGSCNDDNATLIALAPTLAAEVVELREALAEIAERHIPDQPAAYGGDEADWARRQHTELRSIARQALSQK